MSKETLIEIRKTEETANAIRASAQTEAKNMLEKAEADGKKLCEDTERQTEAELRGKLEKMREISDKKIAAAKAEAESDAENLTRQAKNRMRNAVQLIIWGIVEKCQ